MYSFYYIRGISAMDTPYFSNIQAQQQYFAQHEVATIDEIYPPHYQNTIKVSKDNLDFNSQINYVSLEFNYKTYYYFIDSVRYINEDIMELSLTMDTIQTYMFDIIYNSATIERKLIRRYNADRIINRNYIRENISQGNYKVENYTRYSYKNMPSDLRMGFIVIASTKPLGSLQGHTTYESAVFDSGGQIMNETKLYTDGLYKYIYAIDKYNKVSKLIIKVKNSNGTYSTFENGQTSSYGLRNILEDPSIQFVYYYDDLSILGGTFAKTGTGELTWTIDDDNTFVSQYKINLNSTPPIISVFVHLVCFQPLLVKFNTPDPIILPAFRNNPTDRYQSFSWQCVPQLIDENYIQVHYGERCQLTTFPMHQIRQLYGISGGNSNNNYLAGIRNISLVECVRGYSLHGYDYDKNVITSDYYLTLTSAKSAEIVPTYNDAWKNYQANNFGNLTMGVAKTIESGNYVQDIMKIPKMKKTKTYARRLTSRVGGIARGLAEDLADNVIEGMNYQHKPDTMSQGCSYIGDSLANSLEVISYVDVCDDLEYVAKYFESYGYKVSEVTNENLLEHCKLRYWYNYIKASNINISLKIINDEDTIERITQRFEQGFRYWNVAQTDLNLGDVCIYENVDL